MNDVAATHHTQRHSVIGLELPVTHAQVIHGGRSERHSNTPTWQGSRQQCYHEHDNGCGVIGCRLGHDMALNSTAMEVNLGVASLVYHQEERHAQRRLGLC
ncbi:hypothetical protein SESBI_04249 [Sesbania bispinosa]|nr:hypothetical protein SESBI_04249 [Sesbania bispinosa]